jgi:hypothetical protein
VIVQAAPFVDHVGKDWRNVVWFLVGGGCTSTQNPLSTEMSTNFIFINSLYLFGSKASGTCQFVLYLELESMIKMKVICGFEDIAKFVVLTLGYPYRNDNVECYINISVLKVFHAGLHIIQNTAMNYIFRNFIFLHDDYSCDSNLM